MLLIFLKIFYLSNVGPGTRKLCSTWFEQNKVVVLQLMKLKKKKKKLYYFKI